MNNLYKGLIWVSLAVAVVGLFLPGGEIVQLPGVGGITNFDTLQLRPQVLADRALDVLDFGGTRRFDVDGGGSSTFSGRTIIDNPIFADVNDSVLVMNGIPNAATSTLRTMSGAETCENNIVKMEFSSATGTLTMATTTNVNPCLPREGTSYEFTIWNSSSSGSFDIVLGASSSLYRANVASSTGGVSVGTSSLNFGQFMDVKVRRVASGTDIWTLWSLTPFLSPST